MWGSKVKAFQIRSPLAHAQQPWVAAAFPLGNFLVARPVGWSFARPQKLTDPPVQRHKLTWLTTPGALPLDQTNCTGCKRSLSRVQLHVTPPFIHLWHAQVAQVARASFRTPLPALRLSENRVQTLLYSTGSTSIFQVLPAQTKHFWKAFLSLLLHRSISSPSGTGVGAERTRSAHSRGLGAH